ncbi:MAG TPA: pitrilysin family protein [Capsulimonadaceae bacterium]|jgi:zinc protease
MFAVRILAVVALASLAFVGPVRSAPAADWGRIASQVDNPAQGVHETRLANGLTILSKEVHTAPVAYFSVWYRVGSRNEISGRTGLSHILEHMMFKGTTSLPPSAIGRLLMGNGAQINASTSVDRTEYHELIAADRLELAIKIEADRMRNATFDATELSHEMSVVRSELEGKNNNAVHDLDTNLFTPTAFTAHPYHWPTIGWREDVEDVANKRDVIYDYYKQHYGPNNAFIVVVGDFNTADVVSLCRKYFGVYAPIPLDNHHITVEPPQRGERRVVMRRPGTTAHVMVGYHVPKTGDDDHYVLDVISNILSNGRGSRLYRALVETGLANGASGNDPDCIDPALYEFSVSVRRGVTTDAVEKALYAEVTKLQTEPVTGEELARAVSQIEASMVYSRGSVSSIARQIGQNEIVARSKGGYRYQDTYLDRVRAITPADIQRVAQQYFVQDNRTVAIFDPQPLPANAPPPGKPVAEQSAAPTKVTDPKLKALVDKVVKSYAPPRATKAASAARPKPVRVVLDNGIVVIVEENHANSTVALSGRILTGSMLDLNGKWGVASLTAGMLPLGTTSKSAIQLALALESVGAAIGFSTSTEQTGISGSCQTKDFPATLGVLADELRSATFPAAEFEKLRGRALAGLSQMRQDTGGAGGAGALAEIAFAQAVYPKYHPYWAPSIDAREEAIKSITVDDLKQFYSTYYRPDTLVLVIVGDVKADDAIAQVKAALGNWSKPQTAAPTVTIPDVPLPATPPADQAIVVPGTPQTSIMWAYTGQLHRTDRDFYAATVLSYILGGSIFDSRLGSTIRDKNGLAYTVGQWFNAQHGAGAAQVFVGTNPHNARRAIALVKQVIAEVRANGVTDEEVANAKAYLTGSYPIRLETNAGIAGQLLAGEDYILGLDYPERRNSYIDAVTTADVNAAARKHLAPEKAMVITSGAAVE